MLHPPAFPKKGDLRIIKIYRGITLIAIAAKVYNALLLNCIYLNARKFLENVRMVLEEIDPKLQILAIR